MKSKSMVMAVVIFLLLVITVFNIEEITARPLYWGTRGEDVRQVQEKLKKWGYYDGSLDGVYGADTYKAILNFQKKNGLTVDGLVGDSTKAALGIYDNGYGSSTSASYSAIVEEAQRKLKEWGYYDGAIDGIYGPNTYEAVTLFQRKNGLNQDGIIGTKTRNALGISETDRGNQKSAMEYDEDIAEVQKKLKTWGYYDGAVDGLYGSKTYEAVVKFQRKNGLTVDGLIGTETKTALGITTKSVSRSYNSSSEGISRNDELTLLAMAINGEARGESYVGQVAVGAVILNRVKHPSFPNTIAGVLYQPLAFESVDTGQIYMPIEESSLKAARDAMNGWDPTGGALYFWNPANAESQWIWSLKPTLKIGKHVFAKK